MVPTFLGAHIVPREYPNTDAYMDAIVTEMLPAVRDQGVAQFCDVTCEVGAFTREQATRMLEAAAGMGLAGRVHADTFEPYQGWTTAVQNGAASADHLSATPDEEIDAVGATSTVATLIPAAELYYFTPRRANARRFIATEVPVAISSDFCSSIHNPSLYACLSLAAAWYRLTPEEIINAVTINAAHSLNLGHEVGTLEAGKRADLLIVDIPHYRMMVYEFGMPRVETVVIGGEVVVSHGLEPAGVQSPSDRA